MFDNMTDYIVLAVLFLVIANPVVYKVVDDLLTSVSLEGMIFDAETGIISQMAVALHSLVFVAIYFVYKTFLMPTSGTASPELVAQAEPEPYDAYEGFAEGEEEEEEDYNDEAGQDEEPEQQPPAQEEPEPEPLQEQKPDPEQMSDPNSFEGFSGGMGGAAY
jgi:outer membrane biosynthesis protein TonB